MPRRSRRVSAALGVPFPVFLRILTVCLSLGAAACASPAPPPKDDRIVNDVTQLNPIRVERVATPKSIAEIQELVKSHRGPVSIGGGRFSMGGQTATDGALQLDMRQFDSVIALDADAKTITVQPGITWRKIQQAIDPKNLSLKIMQTYSNFTVGGSLSVNVHGRYIGQGPLIRSVRSLKLVLADGTLVEASPQQNSDLFYAAVGGYGGIGVIVEATLDLADDVRVERRHRIVPLSDYRRIFASEIRDDKKVIFHNGDIYLPHYDRVSVTDWVETEKPVTVAERLIPENQEYKWGYRLINWWTTWPFGYWLRQHALEPYYYSNDVVEWRNYEASYDVKELEPPSRRDSTFVLQEYFVPVERFDEFVPRMRDIFNGHHAQISNVSIRHALPDPGSLLAWARNEVFSFVVYYKQGTTDADRAEVGVWTRAMIDAAVSVGGAYYLPYQILATEEQFKKAYPRADEYFAVKRRVDPDNKFRNRLLDRYYPHPTTAAEKKLATLEGYKRGEEQSFLTVPEWYIVFNSEEYARHLKAARPSAFPHFRSIREYWHVSSGVRRETRQRYPSNWGYDLMLAVIGSSFTVENAMKGVYEGSIGRLAEWAFGTGTAEERFAQDVNDEYVRFIHDRPWYEFPYWTKLGDLGATTGGGNLLRRIERRMVLQKEFGTKAIYGWLIRKASGATYEPEAPVVYALVDRLPDEAEAIDKRLRVIERFPDGRALITAPRYDPFGEVAVLLARRGARFLEIAGNHEIVLSILMPAALRWDLPGAVAFESAIVTEPQRKRLVIRAPVGDLSALLAALEARPELKLEHVYDY